MTMFFSNKYWLCKCVFLLIGASSLAQENLTGYWQPSFGINFKVTETYTHNFSLQNRNYIFDDKELKLSVRQLDLVHFSNLQVRDNQSIALGILYRLRNSFDESSNELRLTQQYNITSKPFVIRYGQRWRAEQRISKTKTIHRFRYRFTIDFPLQGEKLDIGEPYIVANAESLLSVAKSITPQYDIRATITLGWKLSKNTKFQIGTEYRAEDFSQELEHILFVLTGFSTSL